MSDHQANGLSIAEAARRLGVSENAIRQRITREAMTATKINGVWQVFVADHGIDHEDDYQPTRRPSTSNLEGNDRANDEPIEAQFRITPEEIEHVIERSGDTYVADINVLTDRFDQLYRERLAEKDQIIAGNDDVIAAKDETIDALRGRQSELEGHQDESRIPASGAPETATGGATDTPWWQFWKR